MEIKKRLSETEIKYIAIIAMLIDHIAWCFVDTYSVFGIIMHVIGRITAPVMTYFIVEGYYHTKNLDKYILRLFIFAVISYIPYIYMDLGTLIPFTESGGEYKFIPNQGMIYTLCLTLISLKVMHSEKLNKLFKALSMLFLCIASLIGDWSFFPIIWAFFFDRYRGNFKSQAKAFTIVTLLLCMDTVVLPIINGGNFGNVFQLGVFLALIPLSLYSGERGKVLGEKADKWFFYIFYPLHMLILGFIAHGI